MKLNLVAITIVLALAGCEMSNDNNLPANRSGIAVLPSRTPLPEGAKDEGRFISAEVNSDGTTGIFVFKREVFYEGWTGPFFTGEPRKYIVDRNIIGSYDINSGKVETLQQADNIEGEGNFYIHSIFGDRVLLIRTFNGELNNKHYWLDLKTRALTFIPLQKEMATKGRNLGQYYLVDENGTLIFQNRALKDSFKTSATEEIWLRRSSGEYERIAEVPPMTEGYNNFKNNKIYFYSAAQRSSMLYDLDSRTFQKVNPKDVPYRSFDKVIGFLVDTHGSSQPQIGRKINGEWQYQEAQINTDVLR